MLTQFRTGGELPKFGESRRRIRFQELIYAHRHLPSTQRFMGGFNLVSCLDNFATCRYPEIILIEQKLESLLTYMDRELRASALRICKLENHECMSWEVMDDFVNSPLFVLFLFLA